MAINPPKEALGEIIRQAELFEGQNPMIAINGLEHLAFNGPLILSRKPDIGVLEQITQLGLRIKEQHANDPTSASFFFSNILGMQMRILKNGEPLSKDSLSAAEEAYVLQNTIAEKYHLPSGSFDSCAGTEAVEFWLVLLSEAGIRSKEAVGILKSVVQLPMTYEQFDAVFAGLNRISPLKRKEFLEQCVLSMPPETTSDGAFAERLKKWISDNKAVPIL